MKWFRQLGGLKALRIPQFGFHLWMMAASVALLTVSLAGRFITSATSTLTSAIFVLPLLGFAAFGWLPVYWNDKKRPNLRDAAATVPWAIVLTTLLPMPVVIAARLGMHRPLSDALFARLDQDLGVSVPVLMAFGHRTLVGKLITQSYPLIMIWLPIAALLPALAGKVRQAQEFLSANIIAFAIGLPIFGILPAVGPWYGFHFAGNSAQQACEQSLLLLRVPGPYMYQPAGVVCFPSFHVIWAVLCARALWGFRWLRLPSLILSASIVLSTMTTGWHYFIDVLGGLVLAAIALMVASALLNWLERGIATVRTDDVLISMESNAVGS
jgi:membrane-associated phospholipid phosphatase